MSDVYYLMSDVYYLLRIFSFMSFHKVPVEIGLLCIYIILSSDSSRIIKSAFCNLPFPSLSKIKRAQMKTSVEA